ncbi:MAG: DinB family protein [Dehalococcoidia bacterium]
MNKNPRIQLVLDELARHRRQFEVFCRSLSEDDLATPVPDSPWTVKDYIAHLATVDGVIAAGFQRVSGTSDVVAPDIPAGEPFDIDDWNAAAVEARSGRSLDELLSEAAEHREDMARVFADLDDAHLGIPVPYGMRRASGLPDTPVPLREILWAISLHDPTHTRDILRALPDKSEEPFVKEWLASVPADTVHPDIAARRA